MNRYQIARYVAIGASVVNGLGLLLQYLSDNTGFLGTLGGILLAIGTIASIVTYVCGGAITGIGMIFNVAKWGLAAVPIFPFNICAFLIFGLIALVAFFLFPIFAVLKAEKMYGNA